MTDDKIKKYPMPSGGNIQLESLPPEAKDAALGRYMDAFSRLEGMIQFAIGSILEMELPTLRSVFAVLMTKQSIDLFDALAQERLTSEGAARVHKICERLGRRNMIRNRIVHGGWTQIVVVSDDGYTQEWVRSYEHANPTMRDLLYTDPKTAGNYTFTIPQLDKATYHVEEVIQVVSELLGDLPLLKLPPPPPEESHQK